MSGAGVVVPPVSFLMDRRNLPFLAGIGEPVVGPEVARILRRPGMGLRLLREGHLIRGVQALAGGFVELSALCLFGLVVSGFLLAFSGFLAMWVLVLFRAGTKMIGAEDSPDAVLVAVFAVAWVVVTAILWVKVRSNIQKSWQPIAASLRLAKTGTVVPGRVVCCKWSSELRHNGWHEEVIGSFLMEFSFVTPAGREIKAWVSDMPPRPTKGKAPEPGDSIVVLYADDHTFQVL
jgi:hypothetical protein